MAAHLVDRKNLDLNPRERRIEVKEVEQEFRNRMSQERLFDLFDDVKRLEDKLQEVEARYSQ